MSHCFRYATNNKTQVLAKQLRLSIGILFRDAVPDFPKRIAEFLNQNVWVEPGRMERAFAWAVFAGDDPRLRSCDDELGWRHWLPGRWSEDESSHTDDL